MNAILERTFSFEDFLESPERHYCELADGHLVAKNASNLSSFLGASVSCLVTAHAILKNLGAVFNFKALYRCFPHHPATVRKPDVSFIRKERLTERWIHQSYLDIAPDLAAEVISPNDLVYEVDRKTRLLLEAGVKLLWVINPDERMVFVHRADGSVNKFYEADSLTGEEVLPGFACRIADLFPPRPSGG